MHVYTNGAISCLTTLAEAVADYLALPALIDQTASNAPAASATDVQADRGFQGYVGPEYQFNARPDSPRADP